MKALYAVALVAVLGFTSNAMAEENHRANPAPATQPAGKEGDWTGDASRVTEPTFATLKVGDVTYYLKANEKASNDVKQLVEKIRKGEVTGKYTVHGVNYEDGGKQWIRVGKIVAAGGDAAVAPPAPPAPSGDHK